MLVTRFAKGDVLVRRGEAATFFGLLLEGELGLRAAREAGGGGVGGGFPRRLHRGSLFGQSGLFDQTLTLTLTLTPNPSPNPSPSPSPNPNPDPDPNPNSEPNPLTLTTYTITRRPRIASLTRRLALWPGLGSGLGVGSGVGARSGLVVVEGLCLAKLRTLT